jgi:hypothetical protein
MVLVSTGNSVPYQVGTRYRTNCHTSAYQYGGYGRLGLHGNNFYSHLYILQPMIYRR